MERISDYLNIKDAAELLGVCKDTLRRWDRAGKLTTIRHPINNYRLYKRDELEGLLSAMAGKQEQA